MIHKIYDQDDQWDAYVISDCNVWRPGSFTTEEAAKIGETLTDERLTELMIPGNRLTVDDLKEQ